MVGQFRSSAWDPLLIISQMVSMQCVFYVGLGVCIALIDYIAGTHRSLDHVFSYRLLHFRDLQGKLLIVAAILNSLLSGLGLWYVIQRTKQCWDFAATVYFFHIILCWIFSGNFPNTVSWWFISLASGVLMTVLGEFLCMRTEMKAIPLSGGPRVDL